MAASAGKLFSRRLKGAEAGQTQSAVTETPAVRWLLTATGLLFMVLFIVLPLIVIFTQAFSKGTDAYWAALSDPDALSAIRLTLLVAAIAVPLNMVFGIAASWAIAKFEFRGKTFLITLIDLPFSVSPVISGLVFVLLFGGNSLLAMAAIL